MRRRLGLLLLLAGCAPAGDGLPLGVSLQGLSAADVDQLQITVLRQGTAYVCATMTATCLRSRIFRPDGSTSADLVKVSLEGGTEGRAARVKLDPARVTGAEGQTLELRLASGTDYLVVAEVLSAAGRVVASGCNVVGAVSSGDNAPITITATAKDPVPDCDPLID